MKNIQELKLKNKEALKKMELTELSEELKGGEKQYYVLKMKLALWELKQTHLLKPLRRYIASLQTLIKAKR